MFRSLFVGSVLLVSCVTAFGFDQAGANFAPAPPAAGDFRLPSGAQPGIDASGQTAQLYETVNPRDLLNILAAAGYDASIDQSGNVNFKINNVKTLIHPYNCDESHQCKSFGYFVMFIDTGIPAELINEYNLKRRWAHAYLNDGHPSMAWDVFLDGGVTYQYLVRSLNMWRDLIGGFVGALNSKSVQ